MIDRKHPVIRAITICCMGLVLFVLLANGHGQRITEAISAGVSGITGTPHFLPLIMKLSTPAPGSSDEWSQFGANAQRVSWVSQTVTNWQYRCAWNGYGATPHVSLPQIEPVAGDGRIYVAAGVNGIYAINENNCSQAWNARYATFNSTLAYDNGVVFALGTNGTLYKLNADNGDILSQFGGAANAGQHLAPTVLSDRVIFASGQYVYALDKNDLTQLWRYDAGVRVDTPPSYSASRNLVVVVANDLYVNAINNANGARVWRMKPTPRIAGTITTSGDSTHATVENGYPAIADQHGVVFVRYQLDWESVYTFGLWQPDNVWIRNKLTANPDRQNVFALSLDSGAQAFVVNVGQGGHESQSMFIDQGRSPVVRLLPDGKEVAYAMCRGGTKYDARWDSHFCEIVLDDTTVPGLLPGYVRYITYRYPTSATGADQYLLTDEQPYVTGAGSQLYGGHWQAGQTLQITDRSSSLGSFANPIKSTNMPSVVERESPTGGDSCTQNNSTHSCGSNNLFYAEPEYNSGRSYTPGFWVHWGTTTPGESQWGVFIVSKNMVIYKSFSDAVFVMQGHVSGSARTTTSATATYTPTPAPTSTPPAPTATPPPP